MPEWGRILLGGIGCFLLAGIWMGLAATIGGSWLWSVDALLIFLVLDRSGRVIAIYLAAGAAAILLAYVVVAGTFSVPALLLAAASILHVALARFLLVRFAPQAARLETAGALAHLLLGCALLSPVAGALVMAGVALSGSGWPSAAHGSVEWWISSAVGTAILLPFILSLAHAPPTDPRQLLSRWREALPVVALAALVAAITSQSQFGHVLLLGPPLALWAALRLDFRSTALLCAVLAILPMAGAAVRWWPPYGATYDAVLPAQELQAYLLVVTLPALFTSLFAQEQRAGDLASQAALQALRAIMDALPQAIVTLTPGGKVSLWSRGAERIFGWRSSEVEGGAPPFVGPEHAAQEASLHQRVLAGNEIRNQRAERRDKDGVVRELVISAAPKRGAEGAITGIISVMDDVTDRRRLEASREEQRAHLAAIVDAVADAIITSDENGTITSFSRAAEAVFGYSAPEMIGRNLRTLMPEPDHSRHDAYLRRYRETGIKRLIGTNRQVTARRKDGSTFAAEITISDAWLDGKRIFAGLVRDLSSKPAAAAAQAGAPPRPDPGTAKFLSKITHDLRQPLHALSLLTGALERRIEDPDSREIVADLSRIVRSTQSTFENIVEWTRLDSGLVGVAEAELDAGDILTALAQEFEADAARRNVAFRWVPTRATIRCDPVLLRRMLRQLVDNAVKFTPSGKVLLGARRRGSMLRLIVADSGVGIPADQRDFIFGAYNQLDPGREAGGLGLGLAIARRLAELAGLAIGVRSAPGKGALFWADVPLSAG
jgi:PAS domain S-box-containing protein